VSFGAHLLVGENVQLSITSRPTGRVGTTSRPEEAPFVLAKAQFAGAGLAHPVGAGRHDHEGSACHEPAVDGRRFLDVAAVAGDLIEPGEV